MNQDQQQVLAQVRERRRLAPVWLLPFIALLIICWLVWQSVSQAGIKISVRFENGRGIAAGKTEVVHNGVAIGKVRTVEPSEDFHAVDVQIEMNRRFEKLLTEQSAFWLVKPQVSFAGVSGLDTLVSGNYIAFNPGREGSKQRQFVALNEPPPRTEAQTGLNLTLRADEMSSVADGSPVYYRKLKVGEVTGYELAETGDHVNINIYIKQQFAGLIYENTRFWNASGVDVSGSLTNLKVRTESLISIIQGGISFYTPRWEENMPNASNGEEFILYRDYDAAEAGIPITIEFPVDVALGNSFLPIRFLGFEVGRVKSVDVSDDLSRMVVEATVRPEAKKALVKGTRFWLVEPRLDFQGVSGLDALLGGRYIAMDFNKKDIDRGEKQSVFKGLSHRPPAPPSAPGLHLKLEADALAGITVGSPVLFRNVKVGSVQSYQLEDSGVMVRALVKPEYQHLINESSRFWNISGVSIEGDLNGFKITTGTLNSLVSGGIAFDTPDPDAKKVKNNFFFPLHGSESRSRESHFSIDIHFESAEGLRNGTKIKYRGMDVGKVEKLELNAKDKGVIARSSLDEDKTWLAHEGARFWLVRPQLGLANSSHLETLVTGQYISVQTASRPGKEVRSFPGGVQQPDDLPKLSGLPLELVASQLGSIRRGNPVYYREIPVGTVTGYKLDNPASQVIIFINIEERYQNLISENSKFWNASGIDIDAGLFKGLKIKTESLESILSGGIAFATPDIPDTPVTRGKRFRLSKEAQEPWLDWAPKLNIKR